MLVFFLPSPPPPFLGGGLGVGLRVGWSESSFLFPFGMVMWLVLKLYWWGGTKWTRGGARETKRRERKKKTRWSSFSFPSNPLVFPRFHNDTTTAALFLYNTTYAYLSSSCSSSSFSTVVHVRNNKRKSLSHPSPTTLATPLPPPRPPPPPLSPLPPPPSFKPAGPCSAKWRA